MTATPVAAASISLKWINSTTVEISGDALSGGPYRAVNPLASSIPTLNTGLNQPNAQWTGFVNANSADGCRLGLTVTAYRGSAGTDLTKNIGTQITTTPYSQATVSVGAPTDQTGPQQCLAKAHDGLPLLGQSNTYTIAAASVSSPVAESVRLASATYAQSQGIDTKKTEFMTKCRASVGALSWVVCEVTWGILNTVDGVERIVFDLLTIKTDEVFVDAYILPDESRTNDVSVCRSAWQGKTDSVDTQCAAPTGLAYHQAWNSFRYIALGLIVISALLMVIAQAADIQVLDAYTVRKVLPRFLFAALFITLSWNALELLAQLSNDVGHGVRDLIYMPFNSDTFNFSISAGDTIASIITALVVGTIVLVSSGALFWGGLGLLALAATAGLAVLIVAGVLLFRKLLLIFLVITSPIAIACYILPNTHKIWDTWKSALTSVLVVFPIISGMIAIGRVFAAITLKQNATPIDALLAMAMYIIPYFLIMLAFRITGGVMSTVTGIAEGQQRGWFDRLGNLRDREAKRRQAAWLQGDLTKENAIFNSRYKGPFGAIGRAIDTFGRRAGYGWQGRYGFGRQGDSSATLTENARINETLKNNPNLMELANDDGSNALMAMSGGTEAGLARAAANLRLRLKKDSLGNLMKDEKGNVIRAVSDNEIQRRINMVRGAGLSKNNAIAALDTMSKYKSRDIDAGDWKTVQDGIDNIAGGNKALSSSLAYRYAFNSRNAGRLDLGGHWNDVKEEDIQKIMAIDPSITREQAITHATMKNGLERGNVQQLMNGHDNQYKQITRTLKLMQHSHSDADRLTAAIQTVELQKGIASGIISGSGQSEVTTYLKDALGADFDHAGRGDMPGYVAQAFGVDAQEVKTRARAYIYDFGDPAATGRGIRPPQ